MRLKKLDRVEDFEKVHFYEDDIIIGSRFNKIYVNSTRGKLIISLPINIYDKILGVFRWYRRLMRLDMLNILFKDLNLIIIRKGNVYNYNLEQRKLILVLKLKQCNQILNDAICVAPDGRIYFGEYGNNNSRDSVNIYVSSDNGITWEVIYTFPPKSIRHIHGCHYDKFENQIWILTGDEFGENKILFTDLDFKNVKILGDGSQKYRAVSIFFTPEKVHWIMDSPTEKNHQFVFDRKTNNLKRINDFPGPVWYNKKLVDGTYLVGTTAENGEGVKDNNAYLYVSKDLITWELLAKFKKDILPMPYFKWGVISFAKGNQNRNKFIMYFEGLKKTDGKAFYFQLQE